MPSTSVKIKSITKTQIALALLFLGISSLAAAGAGMKVPSPTNIHVSIEHNVKELDYAGTDNIKVTLTNYSRRENTDYIYLLVHFNPGLSQNKIALLAANKKDYIKPKKKDDGYLFVLKNKKGDLNKYKLKPGNSTYAYIIFPKLYQEGSFNDSYTITVKSSNNPKGYYGIKSSLVVGNLESEFTYCLQDFSCNLVKSSKCEGAKFETEQVCQAELEINDGVVDIFITYYGEYFTDGEIENKIESMNSMFESKIDGLANIKTTFGGSLEFIEDAEHDYQSTAEEFNLPMDKAKRVWFYYNEEKLDEDLEYVKAQSGYIENQYDLTLFLTDANFQGKGGMEYYPERMILELVSDNAWTTQNNIENPLTNEELSDVFIHEMGHYMGLDHSCSLTPCSECAYPDDIMSYCRETGNPINSFSSCNKNYLQDYLQIRSDGSSYGGGFPNKLTKMGSCEDLSNDSLCYGVSCKSYCDTNDGYHLGSSCDFLTGQCGQEIVQDDSKICKEDCSRIISRTNINLGQYSSSGVDGFTAWIALDLDSNSEELTAFGWSSYVELAGIEDFELIGFTWDGLSIEKADGVSDSIYVGRNKMTNLNVVNKVKKYTKQSMNSANAIISKNSVPGWELLEFVGNCGAVENKCTGDCAGGVCDPFSGQCVTYVEHFDPICSSKEGVCVSGLFVTKGEFDQEISDCKYIGKENVCKPDWTLKSRTNVTNGEYGDNANTIDGHVPWVYSRFLIPEYGTLFSKNFMYMETIDNPLTFWSEKGDPQVLTVKTWDGKDIEWSPELGPPDFAIVDGKYLYEQLFLPYIITKSVPTIEFIDLEYFEPKN